MLSRLGLLTATRLVSQFTVWLPRELREILRSPRTYMGDPSPLLPRVYCSALRNLDAKADAEAVCAELSQWDRLPESDELAALPLHYLGERADESFSPALCDSHLRERYEQLQRGLDLKLRASSYDQQRGATVAACVRDAAALCAALQPHNGFILSRLEVDGTGAPALCDYLDAWGVPVSDEIPDCGGEAGLPLRVALARAGLGPVSWSGISLVAVHVVLPGFPIFGGADPGLDDDAVARLWTQATVIWHRV